MRVINPAQPTGPHTQLIPMAQIPAPVPLYPLSDDLAKLNLADYPELAQFLTSGPDWWRCHWSWGQEFLSYIGRNKSAHTFLRFRTETERFLLWAFLIKQQPVDQLKKADILQYADFCWAPPANWICVGNYEKYLFNNGAFCINPAWAPFKLKPTKHAPNDTVADKKKYVPSQQTVVATFTALIAFYKFLMVEEYASGNPAQIAKSDCRHFIKDAQVSDVKRLSAQQWDCVLQTVTQMADEDSLYERSLFVIAALKTLFLRISELSERPRWVPIMGHFWQDSSGNWWLKIFGKGRKIRDITVPPSFMDYLKRYRRFRGLSPLPSPGEPQPLVEKIRGRGGMTARHLMRIVQEVFDRSYDQMRIKAGDDNAYKLKEASSHWLRHTGASMEIERGRALKDLSEDLGHASMATTDAIYVQTEHRLRAQSGRERKV